MTVSKTLFIAAVYLLACFHHEQSHVPLSETIVPLVEVYIELGTNIKQGTLF